MTSSKSFTGVVAAWAMLGTLAGWILGAALFGDAHKGLGVLAWGLLMVAGGLGAAALAERRTERRE